MSAPHAVEPQEILSVQPDVSIIVPVHNDEEFIASALESCLAQSYENFEIICIDDASTDATPEVIASFQARDPRISLYRQDRNRSAFQARRVGIMAARAPYVLFLDGDDELLPSAAQTTLDLARAAEADVVGFGVHIVSSSGRNPEKLERELQPTHESLAGGEILTTLFPVGKAAQGHVWKYLWSTDLLKGAYASLPRDLELYRANDLPIAFLSIASAKKYVSTSQKLLRYYWRRGTSGQEVKERQAFEFYLSGLASVDAIRSEVERLSLLAANDDGAPLLEAYESARLSIVGNLVRYWSAIHSNDLREECLLALGERAGFADIVRAAASFFPDALPQLVQHRRVFEATPKRRVHTVLLTATNLDSGGAQGVVASQAEYLAKAGFRVVIGLRSEPDSVYELPPEVDLVRIWGTTQAERIGRYLAVCQEYDVDVAIDHWILYRDDWPFVTLAAATLGVRTIGWIHNFALRPLFDGNRRISFLSNYLPLLWKVVTLSEADVAFWKLRDIESVVYLPNPPPPLLREHAQVEKAKELSAGPIRLVWWGRLQQSTKRVMELVEVAATLRGLGVDFRLTIIGPDSPDLSSSKLALEAQERGVEDAILLPGPMHGESLRAELESSDILVYTSAIEGYPLTLVEAQALGLPIAMYELPWLATLQNNNGVLAVPQFDAQGLAQQISMLSQNPAQYQELSWASLQAARSTLAYDFTKLYAQLLADDLPDKFSPEPIIDHAQVLLDRATAFAEQQTRATRRREKQLNAKIQELMSQQVDLKKQVDNMVQVVRDVSQHNLDLKEEKERLSRKSRRQRSRVVELTRRLREDDPRAE